VPGSKEKISFVRTGELAYETPGKTRGKTKGRVNIHKSREKDKGEALGELGQKELAKAA